MLRFMSYSTFKLALVFILCPLTLQQTLPPKAVNAERIKLLKDALSWMTFRKNGQLASDQDLEPLFEALKDRYLNSKYYKTMIIAFSRGVLPKLTLKENDPCNPAYTLEYKDSHNNSVTDGQLKTFILGSYDKRGDGNRQFCDYREGLVCNQQTSKCECPPGSKMEPVSQGSAVKRCLLQENEVCSLIDLDNDPNSNYGALKKHLPEMVLNLEKPLSCKIGTQCRFKSTDQTTPRCYPVNSGPWDKGKWDMDLGEECTLGLYGDTGQCRLGPEGHGPDILNVVFSGYTCFNFGPRSQPKSPRVGICAHDVGSYGISTFSHGSYYDLQMIGFVSPATTPLRGKALYDYYLAYTKKLWLPLTIQTGYQENVTGIAKFPGDRCNIAKTEEMFKLLKFFKSLEDTPPQGKDYLATEAELDDKFKQAEALAVDLKKKMCRYRSEFYSDFDPKRALRCVRNSTDAAGNDGRCQVFPESEDVSLEWAKSLFEYREHVSRTNDALEREEYDYRKDIYEPDLECDPKLGPPPGSQGAAPSTDSFVLEGGYCPPDRGCYEDYDLDIYQFSNCSLKDDNVKVWRICQNLNKNRHYGHCEDKHLDKLFDEELQTLSSISGLQRGDACQFDTETWLREWIEKGRYGVKENKYKRLIELQNFKIGIGGTTLCDRTKLLECSQKSGTCECLPNTQPREVTLEAGVKYYSDYCYVTSGDCRSYTLRFVFGKSSQIEKNEINRHYGQREGEDGWDCLASNWCVFTVDIGFKVECTTENTGSTGYLGEEAVTTTTTARSTTTNGVTRITTTEMDESELVCKEENCGWQDAGEAQKEIHVILKMIILIKILIVIV